MTGMVAGALPPPVPGFFGPPGGPVKYWGEEKQPDAVYAVFLRKVRYVPPTGYDGAPRYRSIDPDFGDRMAVGGDSSASDVNGGVDQLEWESVKEKHIKAGTLDKLVECLIGPDNVMDSRHFNVFFATYRAFAKAGEVLERLLERFGGLEQISLSTTSGLVTQNSIRSVLVCWLDMYPEDFYTAEDDFALLARLIDFSARHKVVDLRAKARKLREHFKSVKADGGMIARVCSLEQLAYAYGMDEPEAVANAPERAKLFHVSRDNCVQIAEQLTYWDAALFKELITHQCQGCVWSRRHKLKPENYYTVKATIDQFNAVTERVMTSIVLPDTRHEFRAKVIMKWIDIARELRALKNFSSLKAVLSGLQSESIHRLKSVWALVPRRSLEQFRQLSAIFEKDDQGDDFNAKKILEAEGTAKSSPLRRPQLIQSCRRTKSDVNLAECQGTVPYLGSFLTDLTMVDNANPDLTEDGLINFEKRQKEFEILAKLRLFQSAARAYKIPRDRAFCAWFHYLPTMNERECFVRSTEIERLTGRATPDLIKHDHSFGHKSNTISRFLPISARSSHDESTIRSTLVGQTSRDSGIHSDECTDAAGGSNGQSTAATATPSSGASSAQHSFTAPNTPVNSVSWKGGRGNFYHARIAGSEFNPLSVFPHQRTQSGDSSLSSQQRTPSGNCQTTRQMPPHAAVDNAKKKNGFDGASCSSSSSSLQLPSTPSSLQPSSSPSFHLARVGLDDELQPSTGVANYKCIKVENGDRMPTLMERILEKHLMSHADPAHFTLVQLLPGGGELELPEKCNPYYAMAPDQTSPMLNLLLRRKSDVSSSSSSSSTAPSARRLNKLKMSNLMRWSSGYL